MHITIANRCCFVAASVIRTLLLDGVKIANQSFPLGQRYIFRVGTSCPWKRTLKNHHVSGLSILPVNPLYNHELIILICTSYQSICFALLCIIKSSVVCLYSLLKCISIWSQSTWSNFQIIFLKYCSPKSCNSIPI